MAFLVLTFCLQVVTQLNAQVAGGILSGRISTTAGARVPNVRVSVKSTANGDTKIIAAAEDGSFTVTDLPAGIFEITASAPGFAEARTTVTMKAGIETRVDIVMDADTSTRVGGTGASGVSGVVSSKS